MTTKSEFLGKNLRDARETRGLSIAKMADFLGLNSGQALQNYEKGRVPRDLKILEQIANKIDVSVDDLLSKPLSSPKTIYPDTRTPDRNQVVNDPAQEYGEQRGLFMEERLEMLERQHREMLSLLSDIRNSLNPEPPNLGTQDET